jgi:hypothetical protein
MYTTSSFYKQYKTQQCEIFHTQFIDSYSLMQIGLNKSTVLE